MMITKSNAMKQERMMDLDVYIWKVQTTILTKTRTASLLSRSLLSSSFTASSP